MAQKPISPNRAAMERFAAQFDPPLTVVGTERIGGAPVAHGFQCSLYLPDHEMGMTAVCFGKGHFKAWLEFAGLRDESGDVGNLFAYVFAQLAGQLLENGDAAPRNAPGVSPSVEPIGGLQNLPAAAGRTTVTEIPMPDDWRGKSPTEALKTLANTPEPLTEDERKRFGEAEEFIVGDPHADYAAGDANPAIPASVAAKSPNPDFVDMGSLTQAERLAIHQAYPEHRFAVTADGRRQRVNEQGQLVDDPQAGMIPADKLEHIRRVARPAMGGAIAAGPRRLVPRFPAAEGVGPLVGEVSVTCPIATEGCSHLDGSATTFRKNSVGDGYTCWKCGVQATKRPQPEPDADAEYLKHLRETDPESAEHFNNARKARAQALAAQSTELDAEQRRREKAAQAAAVGQKDGNA